MEKSMNKKLLLSLLSLVTSAVWAPPHVSENGNVEVDRSNNTLQEQQQKQRDAEEQRRKKQDEQRKKDAKKSGKKGKSDLWNDAYTEYQQKMHEGDQPSNKGSSIATSQNDSAAQKLAEGGQDQISVKDLIVEEVRPGASIKSQKEYSAAMKELSKELKLPTFNSRFSRFLKMLRLKSAKADKKSFSSLTDSPTTWENVGSLDRFFKASKGADADTVIRSENGVMTFTNPQGGSTRILVGELACAPDELIQQVLTKFNANKPSTSKKPRDGITVFVSKEMMDKAVKYYEKNSERISLIWNKVTQKRAGVADKGGFLAQLDEDNYYSSTYGSPSLASKIKILIEDGRLLPDISGRIQAQKRISEKIEMAQQKQAKKEQEKLERYDQGLEPEPEQSELQNPLIDENGNIKGIPVARS